MCKSAKKKTKWKRSELYIAFSYRSNKSKPGNRKIDCYVKLVLSPFLFPNKISYLKIIKSTSQITRVYMVKHQSVFKHLSLGGPTTLYTSRCLIIVIFYARLKFLKQLYLDTITVYVCMYLYNCDGHKRVQSNSECKRQTNRFLKTRKLNACTVIYYSINKLLLILVIVRLTPISCNFQFLFVFL